MRALIFNPTVPRGMRLQTSGSSLACQVQTTAIERSSTRLQLSPRSLSNEISRRVATVDEEAPARSHIGRMSPRRGGRRVHGRACR
jgi:hypothetical protein